MSRSFVWPREHGAWAMFLLPFFAGLAAAGELRWEAWVALAATLGTFLAQEAAHSAAAALRVEGTAGSNRGCGFHSCPGPAAVARLRGAVILAPAVAAAFGPWRCGCGPDGAASGVRAFPQAAVRGAPDSGGLRTFLNGVARLPGQSRGGAAGRLAVVGRLLGPPCSSAVRDPCTPGGHHGGAGAGSVGFLPHRGLGRPGGGPRGGGCLAGLRTAHPGGRLCNTLRASRTRSAAPRSSRSAPDAPHPGRLA